MKIRYYVLMSTQARGPSFRFGFASMLVLLSLITTPGRTAAQSELSDDELLLPVDRKKADLKISKTPLNPKSVQERALKSSIQFKQYKIDLELAELSYNSAFHAMFLPSFGIDGFVAAHYTLGQIPSAQTQLVGKNYHAHAYPSSGLSIGLGEYTLYNGGKDSIAYKKEYVAWGRTRGKHVERDRETRFNALIAFTRYQTDREKLDAAERYLNLSVSLARLVKTRVKAKKIAKDEYFSAINDVLEARNNLDSARLQAEQSLWDLNKVIGDSIGDDYSLEGKLEFRPLKMTLQEAVNQYKKSGPSLLDTKANLENKRLSYELASRERIPYPRVTLSPLKVTLSNELSDTYDSSSRLEGRSYTNTNVDVGIAVSISLPLWSDRGFLYSRSIKGASLELDKEELQSLIELQNSDTQLRFFIQQIKKQESLLKNSEQQVKNSVDLLDGLFARLSSAPSGASSRLELRDALRSAFQAELDYREALLEHAKLKFELAKFVGVDLDENLLL